MREIVYDDHGKFILKIDGEPLRLSFCLGIYKYLGVDELENMQLFLSKTGNVFEAAVCLFNENIKKYNREYNGCERPITYKELLNAMPQGTDGIKELETWVRYMHVMSQVGGKRESANTEHKDGIKPTVTRLAVLGTSALGLSYGEVMGLTVREVNEMLDAYNVLHPSFDKKKEVDDLNVDYANEGVTEPPELL